MAESSWGSYRHGWRSAVVVLVVLGLITASVFVGWSTIVIAFLMGGTLVASVHLSVGLAQEKATAELIRDVLRWAVRAGLCVVAIAGYMSAIGTGTFWLVVLLALTSPPVVSWFWPQHGERVRRPATPPAPRTETPAPDPKPEPHHTPKPEHKPKSDRMLKKKPQPEPPPTPEPVTPTAPEPLDLTDLSDADLCLAWRRSFTELQSCTTDEQRLAVIAARHAYLDELERRAPEAFSQWLESGARAAGNPGKFFSPRTNHGEAD